MVKSIHPSLRSESKIVTWIYQNGNTFEFVTIRLFINSGEKTPKNMLRRIISTT